MTPAKAVPESHGQAMLLILDTASVERVVQTTTLVSEKHTDLTPVVVSSIGRAGRFGDRGLQTVEAGDRSLDLRSPNLQDLLDEDRTTTVIIPLGWPREALRHVGRFVREYSSLTFLVDFGFGPLGVGPLVLRCLLGMITWMTWVPQLAFIRILNFIDGPMTIGIQWLARVASPRKKIQSSGSVCHVIPSLGTGGAQRQLVTYLRHTAINLSKVSILVLWGDRSVLIHELEELNLRVVHLSPVEDGDVSKGAWARGLRLTLVFWRLFIWFKRERPACVYSWLFFANVLAPPAASLAGVPRIVATVRNLSAWKTWGEYRSWWMRPAERESANLCNVVVANSEAVRLDFTVWSGLDDERIAVVPNGVDIQRLTNGPWRDIREIHRIPVDETVVLNVARLSREKGQDLLLRSFAEVRKMGFSATLIFVGHGPFEPRLRKIADELKLSRSVVFAGRVSDPQSYYRAANVFVLSSLIEGLPNVVLEAQVFGLPVVATRAGGTVEVIEDEATGLLVDSGDLGGLSMALSRVLGDRRLADRLGESGARQVSVRFCAKTMARRIDSIIQPQGQYAQQ